MKKIILFLAITWCLNLGAQERWEVIPGGGRDIGVGANGTVWVLGMESVPGGYPIFRWNGTDWQRIPGGALRIDVDPNGNAWCVNSDGLIFRWVNNDWQVIPGGGRDIGVGANGTAWVLAMESVPGGYPIFRWNGTDWENIEGIASNISVGPNGMPWVTNSNGAIFQRVEGNSLNVRALGHVQALNFATLYSSANFEGNGIGVIELGRKTLSEIGLTSLGSIRVAPGYKAIITFGRTLTHYDPIRRETVTILGHTEEILSDRASNLPNEITAIEIVNVTPPVTSYLANGYVDMHTHPMSHLGFGRKAMHGVPDIGCIIPAGTHSCNPAPFRATTIDQALGSCNSTHGGWGVDNGCGDYLRAAIINYALDGAFEYKVSWDRNPHGDHEHAGYPDLRFWPNHTSILHQQMWVDWIKRAYDGGLRVMVALTVNSELLGEILNGDPPYDDKTVADVQIDETIRFVNAHPDFMEIAYSAADMQRIIRSNRLAVVLGMEVDKIGNFGKPGVITTAASVRAEIQRLHNKGIRYIFPIHLIDNSFGGTAVYEALLNFANKHANGYHFNVMTSPDPNVQYRANITDGPIGFDNSLILGLRGFLEGIGQLPAPCFNDAIKCFPPPGKVRCCGSYERVMDIMNPSAEFDLYRLIPGGHANSRGLTALGETAINEMMKLGMIIDVDHMSELAMTRTIEIAEQYANNSGYPLTLGHNGVRGADGNERGAPLTLIQRVAALGGMIGVGTAEATPESFATSFRKVWNAMGGRGVAIGSDVNGFEPLPKRSGGKSPAESVNFYNSFFQDSDNIINTKCRTGNRTWDYIEDGGVAHYGIMPEFLHDVKIHGGQDVIANLNNSTTYFTQMWKKCERLSSSTAMRE